jgi:plasmid stabilization system protein ParE
MRYFAFAAPFQVHLILYRSVEGRLMIERVMHGARDLPRRLLQEPGGP